MKENQPGPQDYPAPAKSNPLLAQLIRLVTRIAVEVADLLRDVRHAVMDDVLFQDSHFSGDYNVRMHLAFNPTAVVTSEKPGLIIRIDPTVAHPTAEHVILAEQAQRLHTLTD